MATKLKRGEPLVKGDHLLKGQDLFTQYIYGTFYYKNFTSGVQFEFPVQEIQLVLHFLGDMYKSEKVRLDEITDSWNEGTSYDARGLEIVPYGNGITLCKAGCDPMPLDVVQAKQLYEHLKESLQDE